MSTPEPRVLLALTGAADDVVELPHGADPADLLAARGLGVTRLDDAVRDGDHGLVLHLQVAPAPVREQPRRVLRRDDDVRDDEIASALRRRRIAAYALVRDGGRVLLTQLSDQARAAPGSWTMPGGGVDPGEDPADAVRREVWEESGQVVEGLRLLGVTTDHWVGRAPNGVLEDFQPIRLLYAATCPQPTEPVVHDVGGTTSAARWVPHAEVLDPGFPLVRSWSRELRSRLRA